MPEGDPETAAPSELAPYAPLVAVLDTCWLMGLASPQDRNLKHPQKATPAKNASVVYAEMLELSCFREVDLADVPRLEMQETFLGPDSDVDKALVSYAVHRARESANVCVATNDGGILAECASLCAKQKLPIFTPLNWHHLEEIYTRQFEARLAQFEQSPEQARGKGWWFLKPGR